MTTITAADAPRRTDWFDGATAPARRGVYERRSPAGPFSCWDGARWRTDAASVAEAARSGRASAIRCAAWRGLVSAPETPCATCRGHTVVDGGVDAESGEDLLFECPDC